MLIQSGRNRTIFAKKITFLSISKLQVQIYKSRLNLTSKVELCYAYKPNKIPKKKEKQHLLQIE